jgi:cytochrome c oxidase subunit 3
MTSRQVLDVSSLPATAFGPRAPAWWGNTLFMVIETVTVSLFLVSYFYLWRHFETWPPPQPNIPAPTVKPMPDLGPATINTILMVVSCGLMYGIEKLARSSRFAATVAGLVVMILVGLGAIGLRFVEFQHLRCRWDENAYGSVVWGLMVVHLTYLIASTLETGLLTLWIWMYGLDKKHAFEVTLTAAYWYWTVAVWLVLYGVIFWTPRIL